MESERTYTMRETAGKLGMKYTTFSSYLYRIRKQLHVSFGTRGTTIGNPLTFREGEIQWLKAAIRIINKGCVGTNWHVNTIQRAEHYSRQPGMGKSIFYFDPVVYLDKENLPQAYDEGHYPVRMRFTSPPPAFRPDEPASEMRGKQKRRLNDINVQEIEAMNAALEEGMWFTAADGGINDYAWCRHLNSIYEKGDTEVDSNIRETVARDVADKKKLIKQLSAEVRAGEAYLKSLNGVTQTIRRTKGESEIMVTDALANSRDGLTYDEMVGATGLSRSVLYNVIHRMGDNVIKADGGKFRLHVDSADE